MLKNFIYLNEPALDGYLSSLEDGLRSTSEAKETTTSGLEGKGDVRLASVQGKKGREEQVTTARADTSSARFERLQRLAVNQQEQTGWIEVVDPDVDLQGVGIGAMVELECEIFVPGLIKALSPEGNFAGTIDTMQALASIAPMFGSDVSGMPAQSELRAMKTFASALAGDAMFIGEPSDGEWRVAGKLLDTHLRGEVEGFARVVGKVSSQWDAKTWKPLLALPGMNLMPREQRREMERKGPEEGQEDNWLRGPALMLDVLAIYR